MGSGTVPIVMGPPRSDYEKIAPVNSFIHVDDFDTPEMLTEYLLELDKDDTKYGRYLQWRSIPDSDVNWLDELKARATSAKNGSPALAQVVQNLGRRPSSYDSFCRKLREADRNKDIGHIEKLDEWWYGSGYSYKSKSFSICEPNTGPSGYPLGWLVTLVYTILYIGCGVCLLRRYNKRRNL